MSRTRIEYTKISHALPTYVGPLPVYVASPKWAGAKSCYVRRGPNGWETAPHNGRLSKAEFSACPVAGASRTRWAAVIAFDYFHNDLREGVPR